MSEVLDYSSGWPRDIAPYVGTVRYVGTPASGKNLTQAEADHRAANGIPQAFVYEAGAGWMLGGRAAGISAATNAQSDLERLGQSYRCVYFAADFDQVTIGQLEAIRACLDGAATILGKGFVGVYGEADVIDDCMANGKAAYGWQTRAWSGGRLSARACLLQQIGYVTVGGVQCDRNTIMRDDWGQWPQDGDSYMPTLEEIGDLLDKKLGYVAGAAIGNANSVYPATGQTEQKINTLTADVAALRASVEALAGSGVDVPALTALLAPTLATAVAPAVADLLAKRLES